MRTSIHIPDELLSQAKRKAAAEGRTLTSLIEEGLRLVIANRAAEGGTTPKQRSKLPISKHRGGLMPGLDPNKLNTQAQEIEDLEYAERMLKGFK